MRNLIKILLVFTLCSGAFAETDKVAHFGVSYALQTGMYGISKKALRLSKGEAIVFSLFATMLVTTAAEYMPGNKFDSKDILANGLGAGAATATILMFDF